MLFDVLASLQGYELAILMMMIVVFIITLFGSLMLSLLDERIWSVDRTRLSQSRYAMLTAFLGFSVLACLSFFPEPWHVAGRVLANCLFVSFVYLVMECNRTDNAKALTRTRQVFLVLLIIFGFVQLTFWRSPEDAFTRGMMVHGFILVLTLTSTGLGFLRWQALNRIDKQYLLIQSSFLDLILNPYSEFPLNRIN